MIKKSYQLEFITPAFLAGANQNRAELRAPSIRGELRWWFRVLGGNINQECELFGGLGSKNEKPIASKVTVRVVEVVPIYEELSSFGPMSDFGYIYYFASVSGNREGIRRTQRGAFFAPGTTFKVDITVKPGVDKISMDLLGKSISAIWGLGTLGLRATRGCGAILDHGNVLSAEQFMQWSCSLSTEVVVRRASKEIFTSWKKCHEELGAFLRQFRKEYGLSGKSESALGYSDGRSRESSALRLRPVKVAEGYIPLLVYSDAACQQASIRDKIMGISI